MLTAPQLYAISQSIKPLDKAQFQCHYCSAPCNNQLSHNEPEPNPFMKRKYPALRPGEPNICIGCWLWRRKRITIPFLKQGEWQDGRCPMEYDWWISDTEAKAIRPCDSALLYERLLDPPIRFCLMLGTGPDAPCHLQQGIVNEIAKIEGGTPLTYTVMGKPLMYNIYELLEALKNGTKGKEPGVQELIRILGPIKNVQEKRERGRPPAPDKPSRVVSASGQASASKVYA